MPCTCGKYHVSRNMCDGQENCQDLWCNSPLSLWIKLNVISSVHLPRLVWNVIVVILWFLLVSICGLWTLNPASFLACAQVLYCMMGTLSIDITLFSKKDHRDSRSLKVGIKSHRHLRNTSTPASHSHTHPPWLHSLAATGVQNLILSLRSVRNTASILPFFPL